MILFKNAEVILEDRTERLCVLVDGKKIVKIANDIAVHEGTQVIDCEGLYLSPGFIDLHVHGGGGISAMCCDSEKIKEMARAHALHGTTSILPTTLAAPVNQLLKAAEHIKKAAEEYSPAAALACLIFQKELTNYPFNAVAKEFKALIRRCAQSLSPSLIFSTPSSWALFLLRPFAPR